MGNTHFEVLTCGALITIPKFDKLISLGEFYPVNVKLPSSFFLSKSSLTIFNNFQTRKKRQIFKKRHFFLLSSRYQYFEIGENWHFAGLSGSSCILSCETYNLKDFIFSKHTNFRFLQAQAQIDHFWYTVDIP